MYICYGVEALGNISLDVSDFDRANWQDVISKCDKKECQDYNKEFLRKAKDEETKNDLKNKAVFELLGNIAYPSLRQNKEMPFVHNYLFDNIDDNYLETLKELVPSTSDAEMKARISDLLWIKKKNYRCAIVAISSYIESSKILEDPENWTSSFTRIWRAVDIAASIRGNTEPFENVINHIETILKMYNGEDPTFLSINLMELLQEYKKGDFEYYALLSEKIALKAEKNHNCWKAEKAWRIKIKWHKLAKEKDEERKSRKNLAEMYVKHAKNYVNKNPPDYGNACWRIEKAIQEYREIKNGIKSEELHQLLLEYESKLMPQMIQTSYEISIPSEVIDKAKEFVREKTLQDAIFALASICHPPEMSKMKKEVENIATEYPLAHLITSKVVNEEGKQIYNKKSMLSGNPKDKEKATKDGMFKHAKNHHLYSVLGIIEPARQQIMQEHSIIQIDDLLPLVSSNPFVPEGRELIYASGLHAGLKGDFLISTHLLIPQLESSIGYILSKNGIITSKLDKDGIQEEKFINETLYQEELNKIIHEDIIFDLKGLLLERCGSNLRNRMAHGLINYSEYESSVEVKYLWWLTLRLCCLCKVYSKEQSDFDVAAVTIIAPV